MTREKKGREAACADERDGIGADEDEDGEGERCIMCGEGELTGLGWKGWLVEERRGEEGKGEERGVEVEARGHVSLHCNVESCLQSKARCQNVL